VLTLRSMQKLQEPGESLSPPEQLPSLNLDESSQGKPTPNRSLGVFATFANASLKTQQLVIACTAALISALVVFLVIQIFVPTVVQRGSASSSPLVTIGLDTLVTGVTVGLITWTLGQSAIKRINQDLEHLQAQFEAVMQGDLSIQVIGHSSKEFGQLAKTFNQMTQVLGTRLDEAQRKAEEQGKEKENLQHKLLQVIHALELTAERNSLVQDAVPTDEENGEGILPPGTVLDFLDNLHSWSKITTTPELLLGSSTLEEVKQRKEELEYRHAWLQALQDETKRELALLALLCQSPERERVREANEG
jgi:HAMP domain-containing protein